jgi:leucyl aminopeptidase (aminopeptidase T)
LPDFFEAAIAPIEGASFGRAVIDGTSLVSGIVRDRFDIAVQNGIVAPIGRGDDVEALRAYLAAAGENGTNLAELGIGTSTLADADALTGTFEDKKIAGTAHLGIGDNRGLGGVTAASIHTDVQLMAVTIELDGTPIVTRGTLHLP